MTSFEGLHPWSARARRGGRSRRPMSQIHAAISGASVFEQRGDQRGWSIVEPEERRVRSRTASPAAPCSHSSVAKPSRSAPIDFLTHSLRSVMASRSCINGSTSEHPHAGEVMHQDCAGTHRAWLERGVERGTLQAATSGVTCANTFISACAIRKRRQAVRHRLRREDRVVSLGESPRHRGRQEQRPQHRWCRCCMTSTPVRGSDARRGPWTYQENQRIDAARSSVAAGSRETHQAIRDNPRCFQSRTGTHHERTIRASISTS